MRGTIEERKRVKNGFKNIHYFIVRKPMILLGMLSHQVIQGEIVILDVETKEGDIAG